MATEGESPTTVDAPLEYITVDSYEWPKAPTRPKRARLETEEQKQRHRADQKRFIQRKRARLEILRQETKSKELQLKYLKALKEEKELRIEQQRLSALKKVQDDACLNEIFVWRPASPGLLDSALLSEPPALDSFITELLFSM